MAEGTPTDENATFSFRIYLENTDGNLVPYVGTYYVVDGTSSDNVEGTAAKHELGAEANGIVTGIKAGQSVVLTQILSKTDFEVEEVQLNIDQYMSPTVTVSNCSNPSVENGVASGEIALRQNARVDIVNRRYLSTVRIQKLDQDGTKLNGAEFKLEKQVNGSWEQIGDNVVTAGEGDNAGIAQFAGLENGTYRITEVKAPDGYIPSQSPSFEVTLPYDTRSNSDSSISVDESSKPSEGSTLYYTITKTIYNLKQTLEIYKVSSTDDTLKLENAEFELKSVDPENVYYGRTDATGKILWYEDSDRETLVEGNLNRGTYTLKETKAPGGYALNSEEWEVVIGQNGSLISVKIGDKQENETLTPDSNGVVKLNYKDTPVFDLPSAGSSGIFGYTMGGTLLLMAGTLILYKMKRKEVQES